MSRTSISILTTTLSFNIGTVISWQLLDSINGYMASYAILLCSIQSVVVAFNLRGSIHE